MNRKPKGMFNVIENLESRTLLAGMNQDKVIHESQVDSAGGNHTADAVQSAVFEEISITDWRTVDLKTVNWEQQNIDMINVKDLYKNMAISVLLDTLSTGLANSAFTTANGGVEGFQVNLGWFSQILASEVIKGMLNPSAETIPEASKNHFPDVYLPLTAYFKIMCNILANLAGSRGGAKYKITYDDPVYPDYLRFAKPLLITKENVADAYFEGILKGGFQNVLPSNYVKNINDASTELERMDSTFQGMIKNIDDNLFKDIEEVFKKVIEKTEDVLAQAKKEGEYLNSAVSELENIVHVEGGSHEESVKTAVLEVVESTKMPVEGISSEGVGGELAQTEITEHVDLRSDIGLADSSEVPMMEVPYEEIIVGTDEIVVSEHTTSDIRAQIDDVKATGQMEIDDASVNGATGKEDHFKTLKKFGKIQKKLKQAKVRLEEEKNVAKQYLKNHPKLLESHLKKMRNRFILWQVAAVIIKKLPRIIEVGRFLNVGLSRGAIELNPKATVSKLSAFTIEMSAAIIQQMSLALSYGTQLWVEKVGNAKGQKHMGFIFDRTFLELQGIFTVSGAVHTMAIDWHNPSYANHTVTEYIKEKILIADLLIDYWTGSLSFAASMRGAYGSVLVKQDNSYAIDNWRYMFGLHLIFGTINYVINPFLKMLWHFEIKPSISFGFNKGAEWLWSYFKSPTFPSENRDRIYQRDL